MTQTVTPYLLYEDGEAAIEFVTHAFGFREVDRATGGAGGLHAELETPRGGRIYLGQPPSGFRNPAGVGVTSSVYVLVDDVDGHYERAKAAGAEIIAEPYDTDYGSHDFAAADPEGNRWSFGTYRGEPRKG
jgi:uncharacterized glyoxalase superfamily protein PhnB